MKLQKYEAARIWLIAEMINQFLYPVSSARI